MNLVIFRLCYNRERLVEQNENFVGKGSCVSKIRQSDHQREFHRTGGGDEEDSDS